VSNQMMKYPIKLEQGQVRLLFSFGNNDVRKYTWNSKRHCNAEYELHVILNGTSVVDVEDKQYEVKEKQAILIAPGIYHKPCMHMKDFERFSLSFTIGEGPLLAALEKKVPECLCFYPSEEFLEYCNLFIQECIYSRPSKEVAKKALAALLMITLLRNLQLIKNDTHENKMIIEKERTAVIDNFFERNFMLKNGCASLADQLHLSTRQLNRYLKDNYGMGFQEKLIQTRMDQTALLLRSTNKQVQEIMELVGYNSITAFYKAFSNKFGMTPQQYRKQNERSTQNIK